MRESSSHILTVVYHTYNLQTAIWGVGNDIFFIGFLIIYYSVDYDNIPGSNLLNRLLTSHCIHIFQ